MGIVFTWVNGSLPCYQKLRQRYGGRAAVGTARDRTINELMYSIRSFEKFAPWHVGPVYIVTPGHIPYWLNTSHSRISVINQDTIIPRKVNPTFNTNAIVANFHHIPNLPDLFMYINDDYLFTRSVTPHDFFDCSGDPYLLHEPNTIPNVVDKSQGPWTESVVRTQRLMNRVLGPETRYFMKHAPFIFRKSVFNQVHRMFKKDLHRTFVKNKFRFYTDVHFSLLYYGVGKTVKAPYELLDCMRLEILTDRNIIEMATLFKRILRGETCLKVLALNDGGYKDAKVAKNALGFYEKFLPSKSDFEKTDDGNLIYSIRDPVSCKVLV